nr:ATP-binding cassette domain-containing protein [Micromonospora trifolii]
MRSEPAVEATGLVKKFHAVKAVDGVDLVVPRGGIYSVLGPNGAGKTTVIRILATLATPDGGQARVLGRDVVSEAAKVRERIGLTGQFATVDEELTGTENLIMLARLQGFSRAASVRRASDLLGAVSLDAAADRLVKKYSGGMRRRLDIAASIIVTPDLLFLDEPTTGLDPRSRAQVWETVRGLVEVGTTILLTTQYLDEADQLADRIAVMEHGKVIAEGTPGQLKSSVGVGTLRIRLREAAQRPEAIRVLAEDLQITAQEEADAVGLTARVPGSDADLAVSAVSRLAGRGISVTDFALGQPSLDEVFLALTGHTTDRNDQEEAA